MAGLLTKEQLRAFGVLRPFNFDDVGLAFSPDGKTLALSGPEITLWDARTGKKTGTLPGRSQGGIARVAFSADGKTLASAGPASAPLTLKPAPVKELWTGEPNKGDDFVGVEIRKWELSTGRETVAAVVRVNDDEPKGAGPRGLFVALSPDLMTMAAPGPGNAVRVWNVAADLRPAPANKDQKPSP